MTNQDSTDRVTRTARQPYLFDLSSCVDAPSLVLSGQDGQIDEGGVQGWMYGDRRLLSALRLTVGGHDPVALSHEERDAAAAVFRAVVPQLGDPTDDPTVFVTRQRRVGHDHLDEEVTVTSSARATTRVRVAVAAAADLSTLAEVRTGRPREPLAADAVVDGLVWEAAGEAVELRSSPPPDEVDAVTRTLSWDRDLDPGESLTVRLRATPRLGRDPVFGGTDAVPWSRPDIACPDRRVPRLVHRGLDDLGGLLLEDPGQPGDRFVAAGSPWFLTLFGRDSLWTARMLMPLGTELALSTLRTLARRQGTRHDPRTEEQPGRILHEVRAEPLVLEGFTLPPTYFGTADATQLFVMCCAEAWQWGADPRQVAGLVPAVERALRWIEEQTDDGFLRYVDSTGEGLSNQGWKDSLDSIQWADGSLARPPIALSEVQAYSYQAAMAGARLLDAFDRPGGDRWRAWAESLRERFREAFWVDDDAGGYPAVALDVAGARVDSVASNMGHLLGTGLLDEAESALVARRLVDPAMSSGFGLRTLTRASPRYSPLSYHGGAVWPHDTAIAVAGLARGGFGTEAAALFRGLVRAAPSFDYRLPELYAGDSSGDTTAPRPYPAACRPQAWAAAAGLSGLVALLGLEVDVPAGQLRVRPMLPQALLPMSVAGLRLGGHTLAVEVDADGRATVDTDHPAVSVQV